MLQPFRATRTSHAPIHPVIGGSYRLAAKGTVIAGRSGVFCGGKLRRVVGHRAEDITAERGLKEKFEDDRETEQRSPRDDRCLSSDLGPRSSAATSQCDFMDRFGRSGGEPTPV